MLQVLRVPTMNQMCVNTNREVRYTFSVVLIAPHTLRALAFVSMVQTNIAQSMHWLYLGPVVRVACPKPYLNS